MVTLKFCVTCVCKRNHFLKLGRESRCFHSKKTLLSSAKRRFVLISTSDSIYDNLAFEEWMYEKREFSSTEYLFMWKNRPAIVCGKHQNPWLEANVPLASSLGLDVARRSSGGGTVYHDQGNLNLSFLKSRENYNRRKNLDLVVQAITDKWNIDLTVNGRDDILLNKFYKVSGTAAKLGRIKSYHHFTLLHSVNQDLLQRSLQSPMQGASSKATKSFPSSVMNLVDQAPGINFESLVNTIGQHFLAETAQEIQPETFLYVNPLDEEEFPGVSEINDRLRTWDWRFGKSPDFSVQRSFAGQIFKSRSCSMQVNLVVKKGTLVSLAIEFDHPQLNGLQQLFNKFCEENLNFSLTHENVKNFKETFRLYFVEGDEYVNEAKWILKCLESCLNFL